MDVTPSAGNFFYGMDPLTKTYVNEVPLWEGSDVNYRYTGSEDYYGRNVLKYTVFKDPDIGKNLSGQPDMTIYVDEKTDLIVKYDTPNVSGEVYPVDEEVKFPSYRNDIDNYLNKSKIVHSNMNMVYNESSGLFLTSILSNPRITGDTRISIESPDGEVFERIYKSSLDDETLIYLTENREINVTEVDFDPEFGYVPSPINTTDIEGYQIKIADVNTGQTYLNATIGEDNKYRSKIPLRFTLYESDAYTSVISDIEERYSWYYNGKRIEMDRLEGSSDLSDIDSIQYVEPISEEARYDYQGMNISHNSTGTLELTYYDEKYYDQSEYHDNIELFMDILDITRTENINETIVSYNVTDSGLERTYLHNSFKITDIPDGRSCIVEDIDDREHCGKSKDGIDGVEIPKPKQ